MSGLRKPFIGEHPINQRFGVVAPIPGLPGGGEPPGYVELRGGKPWRASVEPIAGVPRSPDVHFGLDWSLPVGTSLLAPAPARVVSRSHDPVSGRLLILKIAGRRTWLWFAHLADFAVAEGELVSAGTLIGHSGASGRVTGAHLHFEVVHGADRSRYNPRRLLVGGDMAGVAWIAPR